jgi:thermostable 8-oxoguanine DNA glycosylase
MDILNRINMVIDEASIEQLKSDIQKEFKKGNSKALVWNRIKRMHRNVNKKQFDKICKSLNESTVTADVAVNRAKGHVDIVNARYKKKKKRSKLTGAPIVVYEDEELDEAMKTFNYIFRGVSGAMTVKAKDKKSAIKKIVKEWGTGTPPANLFVWEKDK